MHTLCDKQLLTDRQSRTAKMNQRGDEKKGRSDIHYITMNFLKCDLNMFCFLRTKEMEMETSSFFLLIEYSFPHFSTKDKRWPPQRVTDTNPMGLRNQVVASSRVEDPDRLLCRRDSTGANDLHPAQACIAYWLKSNWWKELVHLLLKSINLLLKDQSFPSFCFIIKKNCHSWKKLKLPGKEKKVKFWS